jgi:uncharacterized Fe-S cluster-containing radical SAM superfamily protein
MNEVEQRLKSPPVNPKTPLECMSCRRFYLYREDRYHKGYSAEDFDAHYCKCVYCQKWVYDYNTDPNSPHNLYRPVELWNSNPEPKEEPSELDRMMRKALEDEYGW